MRGDAFLHPEDHDDEPPNLTKDSFKLLYPPDGTFQVSCGSGNTLINPLYSIFCQHVVDASVLLPGEKSFACPHKGCGEIVPWCDTAQVNAALHRLHPKLPKPSPKRKRSAKRKPASGGKKRAPATITAPTRRSPRTAVRQKRPVSPSPSTVTSSTVLSSAPASLSPSSSSCPEAFSVSFGDHNPDDPTRILVLGSRSDEQDGNDPNLRPERHGLGSRSDPIIID